MKILGICASPRGSQSTTLRLVRAAMEGAAKNGADVELIDLCQLEIKYCNACQACFKSGKCVHKDDFPGLYEKILAADGLVMGSPNYFYSVTAQLKTLIDRMADAVHCQLLTGKYCCNLATGGSNYDQVTGYLDRLMVGFGAFVTGSAGVEMSKGPGALEEGERKARELGRTLVEDIRARRDYAEQRAIQEGIRSHFKELVRMNKDSWQHEYEHWNSLNWR